VTGIAGCTALITGGGVGHRLSAGEGAPRAGAGHLVICPRLEPEYVAREIVSAIRKDRVFVHLPTWFRLVRLLRGRLPVRRFDRVAGEWFGIYHSMSTFTGRAR
jgi:hypothetical protein